MTTFRLPSALIRGLALASLGFLLAGAYRLDFHGDVQTGYALLLLGAILVVLLPESSSRGGDENGRAERWFTRLTATLLFATGTILSARSAQSVGHYPTLPGDTQALLWLTGCLGVVLACHLLDRHRGPFVRLFDGQDWAWILALATLASATRVLYLGVSPPGLVYDELMPFSNTLATMKRWDRPAFWLDEFALNGIFHYLNALSIAHLSWLGLDALQAAKLPGALCGGLSVAALYATARVLGGPPVAATAGVFLVYEGWHWILSRLYYAYAGDLLWISLTTAFLLAGLRSGRYSLLALSAMTAAVGVAWLKTAVLALPWAGIVLLDHFVTHRRTRGRFLFPAAWGIVFAVCMLPVAAQLVQQSQAGWRYTDVSQQRVQDLNQLGLTSAEGYYRGLLAAIDVLQVRDATKSRHSPRPGRPALDLVLSAMATVGFVTCLRRSWRDRAARLCLLGFLFFLWPAVASYPVNTLAAVSRRMAGCSIFVAWMAAQGTELVAARLLSSKLRFAAMLAVAATSLVLNAHSLRTVYGAAGADWYNELGVNRVYMLRALRQAAEAGPVFFRTTFHSDGLQAGLRDLADVKLVETPAELRDAMRMYSGQLCSVILPWDTKFDNNDSPRWVQELADVIPPHDWQWGPPDLLGDPIYRIARVRPSFKP